MSHISETVTSLLLNDFLVNQAQDLSAYVKGFSDVCIFFLPICSNRKKGSHILYISDYIKSVEDNLGPSATFIVVGEVSDLIHTHACLENSFYHHWISIKRKTPELSADESALPHHHFGATIYTKYKGRLRHCITRIGYAYCPVCDKTTKDYGGKKNSFHYYGTLISDVWRDIECDLEHDISTVIERFANLFSVEGYKEIRVLDCRKLEAECIKPDKNTQSVNANHDIIKTNILYHEDCILRLKQLPSNSVDFIFVDPPYNLGKKYKSYSDNLEITRYFEWCDQWLNELIRILKPGRTLAVLNIPLRSIRHFIYLEKELEFQNWIVWDALAIPARKIMPSHYTIVCFSKGQARKLAGSNDDASKIDTLYLSKHFKPLRPLAEQYCLRDACVKKRIETGINDRVQLTDLWWDIHRLKHNTRRVDHPTQLPPQLLYRLISLFTTPGEIVLDCFNGTGTTTLTAHQLHRQYIGIEISEKYHEIALARHEEICQNIDPFRKEERPLTEKNNGVRRLGAEKYQVPKKELQLEVKRIAMQLGHIPNQDELAGYSKYPFNYYKEYFANWAEVYAAARTTGMTESRSTKAEKKQLIE